MSNTGSATSARTGILIGVVIASAAIILILGIVLFKYRQRIKQMTKSPLNSKPLAWSPPEHQQINRNPSIAFSDVMPPIIVGTDPNRHFTEFDDAVPQSPKALSAVTDNDKYQPPLLDIKQLKRQ